jgi:hypothetical protein
VSLSWNFKDEVLNVNENLTTVMGRYYYYQDPKRKDDLDIFVSKEKFPKNILKDESIKINLEEIIRKLNVDIFVYPTNIPSTLKDYIFSAYVDIPSLQCLDYEKNLNLKRLTEFSGNSLNIENIRHHPLL